MVVGCFEGAELYQKWRLGIFKFMIEDERKMSAGIDIGKGIKEYFFTNIAHFIFPNISKYSNVLPDIDFFYQYW
jgi:hypothetical protein